jgi:hypothetical protein
MLNDPGGPVVLGSHSTVALSCTMIKLLVEMSFQPESPRYAWLFEYTIKAPSRMQSITKWPIGKIHRNLTRIIVTTLTPQGSSLFPDLEGCPKTVAGNWTTPVLFGGQLSLSPPTGH